MKTDRLFSAAVLAGGKSSRMGRDKAALPFGGGTLLAHQAGKLRALGIADLMISGSAQTIADARPVPDVFPGCGPLSGIHACLAAAKHDAVLFLPVDVPLLPVSALQALLDAHRGGVTLLRHGARTEPLLGVYDTALAPLCEPILQSGDTTVKALLALAEVTLVEPDVPEDAFSNCNTPEEYEIAIRNESEARP